MYTLMYAGVRTGAFCMLEIFFFLHNLRLTIKKSNHMNSDGIISAVNSVVFKLQYYQFSSD